MLALQMPSASGTSACTGTSALDAPVGRNKTMSREIALLGHIMHLSLAKLTYHPAVSDYLPCELCSLAQLALASLDLAA